MARVIIESMDITYSKMTNCFKSIGGYVLADELALKSVILHLLTKIGSFYTYTEKHQSRSLNF